MNKHILNEIRKIRKFFKQFRHSVRDCRNPSLALLRCVVAPLRETFFCLSRNAACSFGLRLVGIAALNRRLLSKRRLYRTNFRNDSCRRPDLHGVDRWKHPQYEGEPR